MHLEQRQTPRLTSPRSAGDSRSSIVPSVRALAVVVIPLWNYGRVSAGRKDRQAGRPTVKTVQLSVGARHEDQGWETRLHSWVGNEASGRTLRHTHASTATASMSRTASRSHA